MKKLISVFLSFSLVLCSLMVGNNDVCSVEKVAFASQSTDENEILNASNGPGFWRAFWTVFSTFAEKTFNCGYWFLDKIVYRFMCCVADYFTDYKGRRIKNLMGEKVNLEETIKNFENNETIKKLMAENAMLKQLIKDKDADIKKYKCNKKLLWLDGLIEKLFVKCFL